MKNLKLLVNEELNKRYILKENFNKIMLIENEQQKFNTIIGNFGQLIDEGHTEEQINEIINEQLGDIFTSLFSPNNNKTQQLNKGNLGKTALSAGGSQLQEWLIGKFLIMLGFKKGPILNAVSTALSEVGVFELINLIRGKYKCQKTSLILVNAIGESIVRIVAESGFKTNSTIGNYIRNLLFEYLSSNGYTQKIANVICQIIQKNKPNISKSLQTFT